MIDIVITLLAVVLMLVLAATLVVYAFWKVRHDKKDDDKDGEA